MRRRAAERRKRGELAWVAAGLLAAQLLLGLGVDRSWLAVRDPEFVLLRDRLAARRAEAPGRPLVLALGSSRTEMALRAGRLNGAGAGSPLVFNFAIPGGGPMMQQVALRRLLAEDVRPDLVFLEVMPMSLSSSGNSPLEEHQLDPARLDTAEAARLLPHYHEPSRLLGKWTAARALPAHRHQAELRNALGLDGPAGDGLPAHQLDAYGWRGRGGPATPEEFAASVRFALSQYEGALRDPAPAAGPLRALRALLALCREEGIAAALVIPPEGSAFRALSAANASSIEEEIRRLAREFGVALYDARTWVGDDGFCDGHHLAADGADHYTERFGCEVLAPELRRLAPRGHVAAAGGR